MLSIDESLENEIEPEHSDVFGFNHVGCGDLNHTSDTSFLGLSYLALSICFYIHIEELC